MAGERNAWPAPEPSGRYAPALRQALEAVQAAGARLRRERGRRGGPRGDGDEHADADLEVEAEEIRPRLRGAFPAWGYRGEETRPHLPPGDPDGHVWLVDPNDATRAFLRGHRGPAVSIALLRDGLPVLGVVYAYAYPDDAGDLLAWAEGEPFTRNGVALARRAEDRPLEPHDLALLSESADDSPAAHARCVAPARFLAVPSIAYRLALAAAGEGRLAASVSGPGDWDYAGGHALLRAVGGEIVGGDGWPVRYTRAGESAVHHGWCFGGDPAVIERAWSRDWRALGAPAPDGSPYPLARPRPGRLISDVGVLRRAQGCLLGQLAGDALGSQVEFEIASGLRHRYPQGVRELTGGGPWSTLAGQPTDDSELALMLARSILAAGRYDPEAAARAYGFWYRSRPFDVGNATRQALSALPDGPGAAEAAQRAADAHTQANGSLMRVSPLAIWGWRLPAERVAALARADSRLTHPSPVCQGAVAAFTAATAHAIRTGAPAEEVYRVALDWAEDAGRGDTRAALERAAEPPQRQPALDGHDRGWVLHALRNAFHQLLFAPSLEEGIVCTVMQGGDTDTTAAIAGALLGACHGRPAVPDRWRRALLACRPIAAYRATHARPRCFWPVDALQLAEALLLAGEEAEDGAPLR